MTELVTVELKVTATVQVRCGQQDDPRAVAVQAIAKQRFLPQFTTWEYITRRWRRWPPIQCWPIAGTAYVLKREAEEEA